MKLSEIDLSKMSRIEKIKTIYEHTGTEITIEDPEIIALCDGIILTNKKYSSRYETSFSNEEILQIVKKCNTLRMETYLLIDNILTDSDIKDKTLSNLEEVKSRGAKTIVVSNEKIEGYDVVTGMYKKGRVVYIVNNNLILTKDGWKDKTCL